MFLSCIAISYLRGHCGFCVYSDSTLTVGKGAEASFYVGVTFGGNTILASLLINKKWIKERAE